MSKTYIIGHTKPDTDAVVAAMALQFLYEQKDCFGYTHPEAVITDHLNPETSYLFERFNVKAPRQVSAKDITENDQIVLVDHNEQSQRLEGIDPAQIVEVVDHHKANLNLPKPIFLTFKVWGSSSTIVYYLMEQNNVKPNKTLASLMLAAILSDTVGYKSATTTSKDREIGEKLAKIAGIDDVEAFALDIFKAKSDLSSLTPYQMVLNDYKIFDFAGQKVLIDQIETVEQSKIIAELKTDLLAAIAQVRTEQKVDQVFVAITDVLQVNTKLLVESEAEAKTAQAAFSAQVIDQIIDIGSKLSRKKEIAPAIEKALSS